MNCFEISQIFRKRNEIGVQHQRCDPSNKLRVRRLPCSSQQRVRLQDRNQWRASVEKPAPLSDTPCASNCVGTDAEFSIRFMSSGHDGNAFLERHSCNNTKEDIFLSSLDGVGHTLLLNHLQIGSVQVSTPEQESCQSRAKRNTV